MANVEMHRQMMKEGVLKLQGAIGSLQLAVTSWSFML